MGKVKEKHLYEDIYLTRFSFGKNWENYLKNLNDQKINLAKDSLLKFLKLDSLEGKSFLDLGCGSGLFSLSAILLGAKKVVSVDVDKYSVECARRLRDQFKIKPQRWEIKTGSVLDSKFIESLGSFDIVYSWGVLHHTGDMWDAFKKIMPLFNKNSLFYLAIYNDFNGLPFSSSSWVKIKKFYSNSNIILRKSMVFFYALVLLVGIFSKGKNPIKYVINYSEISLRGMSFYSDIVDWMGGYPYEYSSADNIVSFFKMDGFSLINLKKTDRDGCNEFLFKLN